MKSHDELSCQAHWKLTFLAHILVFSHACSRWVRRQVHTLRVLSPAGGPVRAALLLSVLGAAGAQAGTMVTWTPPSQGLVATNGKFLAILKLSGTADPRTLKIRSGNLDVTGQFNPYSCSQVPCTLQATLTTGAGVVAGQNYLTANVSGAGGSAETARLRFAYTTGVIADPTDGSEPGYIVPIRQTTVDPFTYATTITVGTATPVQVSQCSSPQIQITVLNRSTLAPRLDLSGCFYDSAVAGSLGRLDESEIAIVLASSAGTGVADFRAIGGSTPASSLFGYAAIGYGGAKAGMAFEAWHDPGSLSGVAYPTIRGNLLNIGCAGRHTVDAGGNSVAPDNLAACSPDANTTYHSFYTFQGTDNQGFAIIPGAAGTPGNPGLPTIYLGNPSNIPLGDSTVPTNQIRPKNSNTGQDLFNYQTLRAQWPSPNAGAGGLYVVGINRADLQVVSDLVYVTNCNCDDHTTDNATIAGLANILVGQPYANMIYIITTVGVPFNADSNKLPLLQAFGAMGVSPYALLAVAPDHLGTSAGVGFSIVLYTQQSAATVTDKFWSSAANTQQHETGALRGVFAKQRSPAYEVVNVTPFDPADLPVFSTGDDYLAHATSFAIGSTEPVAWPHMSTPGEVNAYHYLSNQLINDNFYGASDPNSQNQCQSRCFDVRYYYTGDQAAGVYHVVGPGAVPYPGDVVANNDKFTNTDFVNVQQQLELEQVYLSDVINLHNYLIQLNTSSSQNVGLALTQAGTNIALSLSQELHLTDETGGDTPLHISGDTFNLLAGVISPFGAISTDFVEKQGFPVLAKVLKIGVPLVSGFSWVISAALTAAADAQKSPAPQDPYLTQLEQLYSKESTAASVAASNFNSDMETATAVFFNGVYSDWFRLQTVGLLAVNTSEGGWYVAEGDQDSALGQHEAVLIATQRIQLWKQIVPQFFAKGGYLGVASDWMLSTGLETSLLSAAGSFGANYVNRLEIGTTTQHPKSNDGLAIGSGFIHRTSGVSSYCEDYYFIFNNYNWNSTWPASFETELMGAPTSTNGYGPLNIDPNWLYDMWGIPPFEFTS